MPQKFRLSKQCKLIKRSKTKDHPKRHRDCANLFDPSSGIHPITDHPHHYKKVGRHVVTQSNAYQQGYKEWQDFFDGSPLTSF